MVGTLVMTPKSVTFRRHDHLVSVLFGDLLSHSYNITFSMFLYLVHIHFGELFCVIDYLLNMKAAKLLMPRCTSKPQELLHTEHSRATTTDLLVCTA